MGKIVCIMGKSASGKDTVYQALLKTNKHNLKKVIPYTTRPIRTGEQNGREYYFCTNEEAEKMSQDGKIIELRGYNTVNGLWQYFTADDGQISLDTDNYLIVGTLESYLKMKEYFGDENLLPVYIQLDDGERLQRALSREREQLAPGYAEMCRRYLADEADFSEEKILSAGITYRFENVKLEDTIRKIEDYLAKTL